jgi:hypothetical protein
VFSGVFWGLSSYSTHNQKNHEGLKNVLGQSPPETKPTPEPKSPEQPTEQPIEPQPTEPEQIQPISSTPTNYTISVMNAIDFLSYSEEPEALLWLDVMNRRFAIQEFANSLQRFDQLLPLIPDQISATRLFRRIADYYNPIDEEDIQMVKYDVDLITVPALYCDRLDLPSNYTMVLEEGVNQGGYQLTHVLLAWIWIQENDCKLELSLDFIENMYQANAALINNDHKVTDLEMEAAAFLCLDGQIELIDDSFTQQVIASQKSDGSWGYTSQKWHTTILGLLFLLHLEFPCDTYPPTLAPKPS